MASHQPSDRNTVTTYLFVTDSAAALAWYADAFGAEEALRIPGPGGQGVIHAEMRLGDSLVMLSDAVPDWGTKAPDGALRDHGILVFVEDVDAVVAKCVELGAEATMPVETQFWGDRMGKIRDPFGHHWDIATHVEDVSPDEIARRAQEMFGGS